MKSISAFLRTLPLTALLLLWGGVDVLGSGQNNHR